MTPHLIHRVESSEASLVTDVANGQERPMFNPGDHSQAHVYSRTMGLGNWAILVVLLLLLTGAVVVASIGWSLGSSANVPTSGYVALALGVVLSMAVGFGLMALVFYSSRKGYDEAPVLLPPDTGNGE